MEAESITPEDAYALGLPLIESTTKNDSKEINFPQKNGNDVNSKYPLAEETRKPDNGKTGEVTEIRSQEIYQESSKVSMESEKQVEHQLEGYSLENKIFEETDSEVSVMMEIKPKSSEPEDEKEPSLPTFAIKHNEVTKKDFEIETNEDEESTTIYDDQSCRPQNELEQMNKTLETIDLTQFVGKDIAENEISDQNFEAPNMDDEITKHSNSGGKLTMESNVKSSYDEEELERTPELHSVDNSGIKDDGNIMSEKATDLNKAIEVVLQQSKTESVPEDKALSNLPTTAPIVVEAVEESIQEDIHKEESPVADTEERHITENGFEKNTVPEVFDLHKGIRNTCMEDEKKAHNQSEAESMETTAMMHSNLKGLENTDISLKNNIEEPEKDPASQTRQKLEMDGQNIMPEEEKEMLLKDEATGMQILKSETESVHEDEHMEKESTAKENKSSGPENEHEQMTKVLEAIENPKAMTKIDTETEENADQQSEASSIKNVIIEHINIKENERTIDTKSSYEMDEVEKNPEPHSANIAETKEVGKITPDEARDIKEATNMELQHSATENKAVSRLHTTASVRIETVEESIQEEMQKEVESAETNSIEGQKPENDFDEKKKVLEAFDQHEEKGNTYVENEKNAEIQREVQNQESIVIKHPNLEGNTIEEESGVIDNNSNQPEYELEQTADIVEAAIDQSKTMVMVSEENEQHADCKSEASCVESIKIKYTDIEGTLTTDSSTKPSSHVDKQEKIPESHSVENLEIKDGNKITPEEATDIKEATSVEMQKFNIKSVSEDNALSTLYTTTSVGVQRIAENIEEEIQTEEEISEVEGQSELPTLEIVKCETKEEILQQQTLQEEESATTSDNHKHSRPVNELEKTANIVEAIDQPETVTKVGVEKEEWEDHQSEASSMESMITKHTNSEANVGSESKTKSSYDVEELEKIPKSQLVKNSGTLEGSKNTPEAETNTKETNDMELHKYGTESVPEDKAPQTLSNSAFIGVEVMDESIRDKAYMEAESAVTETRKGQKPENDFEMKMIEAFGLHEVTFQTSTENELKAEPQSKVQNQETTFAKHPDFKGETLETNSTNDIEEHNKVPMSHNGERFDIKDNWKFTEEEAREMDEATKMKLLKTETERATEDEGQSVMLTLANVKGETEETLWQQILQEEESAVIDNDKSCSQENELPNMADVVEETDQPKTVAKVCSKHEEHADYQSEPSNEECVIKKHIKTEGKVTSESGTESSYNMDEWEKTPDSKSVKSEIVEGMIEDKALQTLPNPSVYTETVDQSKQEEMHTEVELAVTDIKEGQIPENDFEEKTKVPEAFDLHEVTCQTSVENELKVEPQSEAQNQETTFIKHVNLEGETTEVTPIIDTVEQEKVPVSCSAGKLEISSNDGRFIQEEAQEMEDANEIQLLKTASESVSEDKAQQTLPTTAYVGAEASGKSIQEIHIKEELEVSTIKEGQIPEIDFEEKMKVLKALGLHDVTHQTSVKNVFKAEPRSEVQYQETTTETHSNLEGATIEINPISDTEKQEKVPASEILEIEDDGKFKQEEPKEMEEETKMQLQKSATESLPKDDVQPTMPTSALFKGNTKELLQQQALHNDETAVVDNDESCRKENELEKMANVVEYLLKQPVEQPKAMSKVDAENEEQADQDSEDSSIQSMITKHINAEGIVTSESRTKSSYKEDEQEEIVDSHLVEDLESTSGSKITAKEATDTKQLTDVDIQKSETAKSLPDNEFLQTLPNTASVGIEVVEESSQEEIHTEEELAVTEIIEGQIPENDFEDKNNIPETFDLHEVRCQPNVAKELKAEPQSEVQNQETTFINHQILEEETTEINPTKDTEEKEKVQASHTGGKLDIEEDDGKLKQEEAKQIQEATEMQLLKTVTESLPEDEVQSTLLTFAIVKSDVKQILQQQTLQDDGSATFDSKSCRQENELEKTSNVEAIDQHEIMTKVSEENEEHADCPSEPSMQRLITEDIKVEGIGTSESSTKSSYDAHKLESVVNSQSVQNFECKDGSTTTSEKTIDIKQSTDVEIKKSETESLPEDKALQTLPNTASVHIEAVGENIQEKEHIEAELTVTNIIEGQVLETDFQATMNIPKEVASQPNAENELKAEPKSEVQNHITFIKHLNSEGETTETNLTVNTEEQEKFTESHNRDKSEIEDDGKFKQEEAKQTKEETEMQLVKTAVESLPDEEIQSTLPTSAIVKSDTKEILPQQTFDEDKSAVIDNRRGRQENEVEKMVDVTKAYEIQEVACQCNEENEPKAESVSEAQNPGTTSIKHLNSDEETMEIDRTHDTKKQERVPMSHTKEKLWIKDDGKFNQEEAIKTATESLPEDEILSTLPTFAIVQGDDQGDATQILQKQTINDDESAVNDTNKFCIQENEPERLSNVLEEIDQLETKSNLNTLEEEQANHQSEASSMKCVIIKYINAEGIVTSEDSTKSSYDADEHEKTLALRPVENLEGKDGSKIIAQGATYSKQFTDVEIQKSETKSEPEDQAQQTLPDAASDGNETVDESSKEEIHIEAELAVIDTKEGQTPEDNFKEKKDTPKAFALHEVNHQLGVENELKDEPHSEEQNQETTLIKHLILDGDNTEMNATNDTEEQDKFPASHTGEKIGIEDDGKLIQEEVKGMKEATELLLLNTAIESIPEDEVQSQLPTSAVVNGKTDEILQQQTFQEDETAAIDNKSYRQGSELEKTSNVAEAIDKLKTMDKVCEENKQHADHQSEASSMQSVIAKHTNAEGIVMSKSNIKSGYDMEEMEKIIDSQSVSNLESNDCCKKTAEEETDMRQLTNVEIQISKTESVPEDEALQTLPIASVGIEEVDKGIQEIHAEVELAIIDTKERQISENAFEEFDLHKVSCQTSTEKEQKAELLSEQQSQETTFIKHPYLNGETTEMNPTNDPEEHEKVHAQHTREKSEIFVDGNLIHKEAKDMREPAEKQLLKTATESIPEDEAQSTLPTSTIVKGDKVDRIFQEQTLKEMDYNNSPRPENELEQTVNVLETIDPPENPAKVGAENEEQAGHQSEQSSMDNSIIKHIDSEGMETTENSKKSSYEVEEQEKVQESDSIDNSEIKHGGKIMLDEGTDLKEATNMELQNPEIENLPEDKSISALSAIPCVNTEKVEESIQEEIQKEAESTATDTKDGWRPENDIVENTKVFEAFHLHEVTSNTCMETEKEVETQSEAQGEEITVIKHPNLEGQETVEISPTDDTKEHAKEQQVAKSGVCESVSADFTKECSTEDIPKLKDLSMLSEQNTNKSISDLSKISAHDYCKLESEKEEKMFIAIPGGTATSTHSNSGDIESQENTETTFEDSLTSFATARVTTELETQGSGCKHEITNDTPAGKILQTVDTNEKLELAPGFMVTEKSDKKDSFDPTKYIADRTFIDDQNSENIRSSSQSIVTQEAAAKMDPDAQRNVDESTKMNKSELQVEKILEPPYPSKKLESYFDSEALHQTDKQLYQTKEKSTNIHDQIFEADNRIQGEKFQPENKAKPEPQMEGDHDFSLPLHAKPTSEASLITKEVLAQVDKAGESENIEEQTIDSKKSLSKVQILLPREDTINQVKDHNEKNFKATDSNEQEVTTESSFDNDLSGKEEAFRDSDEAIEEQEATTAKRETQETKNTQLDSAKEEEFEKISPSSRGTVIPRDSRDTQVKVSHKKSHGILSGVGTKVKHSISKVKKAITGKSSHPKTPSQK